MLAFVQLLSLKELAERLKKQLSREKSKRVQTRLKKLRLQRGRIKELSARHREELELSRMMCIFKRDANQVTVSVCSVFSEGCHIFRRYHL